MAFPRRLVSWLTVPWSQLACGLLACTAGLSPAASQAPAASAADAGAPVLRIDGQEIGLGQYCEWMLGFQGRQYASEYAEGTYLIAREARRSGIEISDEEVRAHVDAELAERIRGAFHGLKQEWLAELERTARSEGGLRKQRETELRPLLEARALAAEGRVVPREKIEREWWLRYGRHGQKHDLWMMKFGVEVESPSPPSREQSKAEEARQRAARLADARAVRERLVKGADFGQLAQENSTDPDTRDHRGRPSGGFDHQGWPVAFLDAIERLAVGELSQPLYARGGWWLVLVRGRVETPLTQVQDGLAADLLARGPEDDEVELVRQRVRSGVRIEVLPGLEQPARDTELDGAAVPALSIDGESVSRATYAGWLVHRQGEALAQHFAEEWLVRRKAAASGISVSEDEVQQRALEFVRSIIDTDYGQDRERWLQAIGRDGGRTEQDFLKDIAWRLRTNLLVEKLILRERKPSESELRARYVAAYGSEGVRREVSLIAISSRPEAVDRQVSAEEHQRLAAQALERARSQAQELVRRARGGEDFAALARQESDDMSTRPHGGRVESRWRSDLLSPTFDPVVRALGVGAVSDPAPWGPTWYVFRLDAVRAVSFDGVRGELERELLAERPTLIQVLSYRNALVKQSRIELLPGFAR